MLEMGRGGEGRRGEERVRSRAGTFFCFLLSFLLSSSSFLPFSSSFRYY